MNVDSLYQEIILDHYRNPRRRGLREPFDAEVHHVNPTCGDEVTVRVCLAQAEGGPRVVDVSYTGQGCSISQAATSVMTELVTSRPVGDALATGAAFVELLQSRGRVEPDEDVLGDGVAFAGVARYPARVKCALLGWMAWKDATARAVAALTASAPADPTPSPTPAEPPRHGRSRFDPPPSGTAASGPVPSGPAASAPVPSASAPSTAEEARA